MLDPKYEEKEGTWKTKHQVADEINTELTAKYKLIH
jgi:hypothetical protein